MNAPTPRALVGLFVGVVLLVTLGGCGAPGTPAPRRYTLLATGFQRGQIDDYERVRRMGHSRARYFGGAARMNSLIRHLRAARSQQGRQVLLADLGDFLSGSAEAEVTRGGSSVAVMSSRGYDAVLVGNREFTFGTERLEELLDGLPPGRDVPLVTSNVYLEGHSPIRLGLRMGDPVPPGFARQSVRTTTRGGGSVRFLGFTPGNLKELVEPENLEGLAVEDSLGGMVERVAPGGEGDDELTVLLCQRDVFAQAEQLAAAVRDSGVDLVLGHAYGKGAQAFEVDGVWFAGVRNDLPGSALVEWTLDVDPRTGRIVSINEGYYVTLGRRPGRNYLAKEEGYVAGQPLEFDQPLPPDKHLAEALSRYRKPLAELDAVLTRTEVDLYGAYEEESTLGNLVADGLRAADPEADVAMISAGVVGHNRIRAGEIRKRDMAKMFPYKNQLVRVEMTGAKLREALEGMVRRRIQVLVSGLRYAWRDDGEAPALEPGVVVGGEPLDDAATYTVLLNSFAHRRDPVLSAHQAEALGDSRELLEAYLRRQPSVEPALEGRFVRRR